VTPGKHYSTIHQSTRRNYTFLHATRQFGFDYSQLYRSGGLWTWRTLRSIRIDIHAVYRL